MRTVVSLGLLAAMTLVCPASSHAQSEAGRFAFGGQYTYFRNQHAFFRNDSLLGVRFDAQILRHLWLTAQLDAGLANHPRPRVSSVDGGRIMLGRFGVKAGKQSNRMGVFADIRGGFDTWSDTLLFFDLGPPGSSVRFGRFTRPLLNLGASVELYATWRVGMRFTAGDTMVFHSERQVLSAGPPFPAYVAHNVELSTGVFYRF